MVCGTRSGAAAPMELTWALLLGLAKHIVPESVGLKNNGPWQRDLGVTLQGKTLGLLGLGKIGGQMAKVAQAFGMRVLAWSQNLTAERAAQEGGPVGAVQTGAVRAERFCLYPPGAERSQPRAGGGATN